MIGAAKAVCLPYAFCRAMIVHLTLASLHFFYCNAHTLFFSLILSCYMNTFTTHRRRLSLMRSALVCLAAAWMLVLASCTSSSSNTDNNKVTYNVDLSGEKQNPALTNTGTGKFTGTYDKSTKVLTFTVTWSLTNNATLTLGHFHGPAAATANAGVRVGFISTNQGNSGTFSSSTAALDATQESELLSGQWYVNLHSTLNGSGALRGQIPAQN